MSKLSGLQPERVFAHFEALSAVPRGSGNMKGIADFCEQFAVKNGFRYLRDGADNIVIFKPASKGYEAAEPIILQGHLDMVCQKTPDSTVDLDADGLRLCTDGAFVWADGTTLGADNGIAVAMIMSILEDDAVAHPAIEAVFTTDEEVGMLGATAMDMSVLSAKRMINLDSEELDTLTVSCAGGSEFIAKLPVVREKANGSIVTVTIEGLRGGHSGVEIGSGRVNADILAGRVLCALRRANARIISVCGGDKSNAIPNRCVMTLCADDGRAVKAAAEQCLAVIADELSAREPDFKYSIALGDRAECCVLADIYADRLVYVLTCVLGGVLEMSADIDGLVETSLNLGILTTDDSHVSFTHSLRSNKGSALAYLEERLKVFYAAVQADITTCGYYPPWEFKSDSVLQQVYKDCYTRHFGSSPKVEAIHAGLECGVFASRIEGLDCIAMGPQLYDVHTVKERLDVASVGHVYSLLLDMLKADK